MDAGETLAIKGIVIAGSATDGETYVSKIKIQVCANTIEDCEDVQDGAVIPSGYIDDDRNTQHKIYFGESI